MADGFNIPNYLKAATPDLLRELMLETCIKLGSDVKFFDIQEMSDKSWITWYFDKINFDAVLLKQSGVKTDAKRDKL